MDREQVLSANSSRSICESRQTAERVLGEPERIYRATVVALGRALDSREADSDGSSLRITIYGKHLGKEIRLSQSQTQLVEQGAWLHDIGKIGVFHDLL